MHNLNDNWRNFIRHFGIFVVIMVALTGLNVSIASDNLLVFWPGAMWGVAILIHLVVVLTESLTGSMRDFWRHFGIYLVVVGNLLAINLGVWPERLYTAWLAYLWGAAVAIHLVAAATAKQFGPTAAEEVDRTVAAGEADTKTDPETTTAKDRSPTLSQPELQTYLEQALAYRAHIDELIQTSTGASSRARLTAIAAQVNDWVGSIETLARRLDACQQNDLIKQDRQTVPQAIERLEQQLVAETDPTIQATLQRTLANRQTQLAALNHLQQMINRAEIQMESTLSSLGTIYSQILTDQSTNQVADYTHLSREAEEETRLLQDHLEALAEVKLGDDLSTTASSS